MCRFNKDAGLLQNLASKYICVGTQQQQQQQVTGVWPCLSTGQHSLEGRCTDTAVTRALFISPESRLMLTQ